MILTDGRSSVELTPREVGPAGTPSEGDLGIGVAATTAASFTGGPFSGRNDTVWISRDDWVLFREKLRDLDRTRRGEAGLMAMSPAEFRLVLRITDRAGHVVAEGWVGREYGGRGADAHDRVSFSIEVDPGVLAQLVRQFETLGGAA